MLLPRIVRIAAPRRRRLDAAAFFRGGLPPGDMIDAADVYYAICHAVIKALMPAAITRR